MAKYTVNIENGVGTKNVVAGTYNVDAVVNGYDSSTLTPTSIDVTDSEGTFNFEIGATGTLTLKVTDKNDGTGTPIVGATFVRCDSEGTTYGDPVTSNEQGEAVLNYIPYGELAPVVYFKQTASDGAHNYSNALQNTTLTTSAETVNIENEAPGEQTLNLTDKNYSGLKINGTINLN